MSKYAALWEYIAKTGADNRTLTFAEIESVCGFSIDHSFLTYKKELEQYGFTVEKISMKNRTVTVKRL